MLEYEDLKIFLKFKSLKKKKNFFLNISKNILNFKNILAFHISKPKKKTF